MWKLLEKLRQRPEPQKRLISFSVALIITITIAVFWLISFLGEKKVQIKIENEKIDPVAEVTPFSNIGSQISEIKQIWGEVKNQFKNTKNPSIVPISNSTSTLELEDLNQATTSEIESSVQ